MLTRGSAVPSIVAWAGAVAFAGSLLWFLYCYVGVWGIPAPPGRRLQPLAVNAGLFAGFALHHSLLARSGLKRRVRERIHPALERSLYTWTSSVLFVAVCTLWQPVPGVLYGLEGLWAGGAYLLQATGVALTLQSARAMDFLDLAGVRAVQHAARGTIPQHVPLQTTGLYGLVRHPLYLAWLLMVGAAPTMTATRASFAVISTGYIIMAISWEEQTLVDTFGRQYEDYRKRVRSKMLPGIY